MTSVKYRNPFDLDTPESTLFHKDIILKKRILKRLYSEWYDRFFRSAKACGEGTYLEIGSGGGFLKDVFPEAVTSDILPLPTVDIVCSAESLPFNDSSIACIMMLNVFHHIPRPHLFLDEAQRCLVPGGKALMIEPANSMLGRFVYTRFHHEPFDPDGSWEIEPGNPVSNSNQALPYIYFERDKTLFDERFPQLTLENIRYHTPFMYLVSGGLSRNPMLPHGMYRTVKFAEWLFSPLNRYMGLFCSIELRKTVG